MKMNLDLLERVFQDFETEFFLEEVQAIAILFLKCTKSIGANLGSDYWLQIGRGWDLNIWQSQIDLGNGKTGWEQLMSIYKIVNGKTDTQNPIRIVPE